MIRIFWFNFIDDFKKIKFSDLLVIPAGVINEPFYDENLPNYINYGAIGSVIGHELTHGFDQLGRLFDKDGLYIPEGLWTQKFEFNGSSWESLSISDVKFFVNFRTMQNFKSKTDCMARQYSTYVDKQTNLKVDGYRSIGKLLDI